MVRDSAIRIPQSAIENMPHRERKNIRPGLKVAIVQKQAQRSGTQTLGVVKDLLTNSPFHPHGIKVRLEDGQVGRIQAIPEDKKQFFLSIHFGLLFNAL